MTSNSRNAIPRCKPVELEFYATNEQLDARYNELMRLLFVDKTIHSFFPQPIKNKKGYWIMEVERYSDEWLKKHNYE